MKKERLDDSKNIIFLGDHHGSWRVIWEYIERHDLEKCILISVGDLGIGFNYTRENEFKLCNNLSEKFKERDINFYGIRGNHDDPFFFSEKRVAFENFQLIEDYSVYEHRNKLIQFIGGAISIDRTARLLNTSYWENEGLTFKREMCQKVDVLVTHTAPLFCFPQALNEMVYGWAREDAYLLEDLDDERLVMGEIMKICKPSFHVYGHFHSSWSEEINGCKHRLLNINEFFEFP